MLDDVSVQVDGVVDISSAVESNEVRMESPAMASFDQTSSLCSGQSGDTKVQICEASSQNSAQTDPSLKAHDYIGLCEVSSRALMPEASCVNGELQSMAANLQETELRLGPPKAPGSLNVGVPFQAKQGPGADAEENDALDSVDGQPSMLGRQTDHALLQRIMRLCENFKEASSAMYMKEVGDAGTQKVLLKSESFKRRCGGESMEGWDLGIGLPAKVMAYPQEEVGENKISCIDGNVCKKSTLDSREQLTSLQDLAPVEAFEEDHKLLKKNASHQQQDVESTRKKQLPQISPKGQAAYGAFGLNASHVLPQERGLSHLQEFGAAHKFWQAHMMMRAADFTHNPKNFELQSHQNPESLNANFTRALEGMNGSRILPSTPKYGMAGAKRVFSEAIGNSAVVINGAAKITSSEVMGVADSESKLFKQQLPPLMFPWGSSKRPLTSWTSGLNLPDGAAPCEPFPPPGKALFKGDPAIFPLKHCFEALTKKSVGQGSAPELAHGVKDAQSTGEEDTTASTQRAPVGWPPVQSFRKNSLPAPKPAKLVTPPTLPPALSQVTQSECLFVKVYMDGLPIGRKVDLRTVSNYDELSMALEEMFKGFLNGQSGDKSQGNPPCTKEKKSKFLCNSEYVIAYEDKDGDLMLVGDVPWGMFVVTVKRLRVMKSSGAIGLSPTASDPVKCS